MSDVLGDWCDVFSFNLSSEGIVILLANKSLTSSQAVTQQRTDPSAKRKSGLSVVSLAMTVAGRWAQVLRNRVDMLRAPMECHGSTKSTKLRCRGSCCSLPMTSFPHAKLNEFLT